MPEYASEQLSRKLDVVKKRIIIEQFIQSLVHAGFRLTKRGIFLQKISEKNPVVVKSVLDSRCKRFCDTAIRKNFNLKPEIQI